MLVFFHSFCSPSKLCVCVQVRFLLYVLFPCLFVVLETNFFKNLKLIKMILILILNSFVLRYDDDEMHYHQHKTIGQVKIAKTVI